MLPAPPPHFPVAVILISSLVHLKRIYQRLKIQALETVFADMFDLLLCVFV
jgi:hypothetical protein